MKKSGSKKPRKHRPQRAGAGQTSAEQRPPKRQEISLDELKAIVSKVQGIDANELQKLEAAVDTLGVLTRELEAKGASIQRLRRLIFGASTEKTRNVVGESAEKQTSETKADKDSDSDAASDSDTASASSGDDAASTSEKPKRKGHGRKGSSDYTGANRIKIPHESLKHGDRCPECLKGKVYTQKMPATLVRVTGVAPLDATVYEMERLRCNLCGEVFTAKAPEGIGKEKYNTEAAVMIGLLKYGCGMPFNRLAKLEASLGIPLPAATQWEVMYPAACSLVPVYTEIIRRSAQGKVLHNDDTVSKILKIEGVRNGPYVIDDDGIDGKRSGIFTSAIVSIDGDIKTALFFTSRKHAGENLESVLQHRLAELGPPIQMSDGSSRNTDGDFETIEAECNCHARRNFVDVANSFPDEVAIVLGKYQAVYANDEDTKKMGMSDDERLLYHQAHSGPVMKELEEWLDAQFKKHNVELNSTLGDAISYIQGHWEKLTMFLKVPGAPLDNNICERAVKKVIQHRKNAYFFRTKNGAFVGDLFMTLIHSTELNDENPFEYIVALLKNEKVVAQDPGRWMPWNFRDALASESQVNS